MKWLISLTERPYDRNMAVWALAQVMSDFIFVTEKTESSGKKSDNNNEFGKETRYTKGARNGGKTRSCTFSAKIETKASRRQLKLLLPTILINYLSQFIEKVLTNNWFV